MKTLRVIPTWSKVRRGCVRATRCGWASRAPDGNARAGSFVAPPNSIPQSKRNIVPVLLAGGMFLAINATLPLDAQVVTYDITTTWYEPDYKGDDNSIFVGSFQYNATTHAVTGLQGQLSEAMTDLGEGMTWLTLTNQVPNGNSASEQYTWQVSGFSAYAGTSSQNDDLTGGTFATVFLQNHSLTFATSYKNPSTGITTTGDGWSPQGGIAVEWHYPSPNTAPNAAALIFVPDNLSPTNTMANPLALTWNETGPGAGTGSLGLSYTAYADNTTNGYMGAIGMTGTSKYASGARGSMDGYPLSEIITVADLPAAGIAWTNSQIAVFWAATVTNLTLVTADSLTETNWTPVSHAPVIANGQAKVTLNPASAQQYFRLQLNP